MARIDKPIVLLVDDNEATCTLVTALLRRDFETEIAGDGNEAVEKLKTKEYAVVLLDIRMPALDGYGVLEFLNANRPELLARTLVLTAALTTRELDRVRAFPICGIIAKPFDVEALLAEVRRCAKLSGLTGTANLLSSGMILLLAEVIGAGVKS
jgi:DNA-binding response OmpR family regulator